MSEQITNFSDLLASSEGLSEQFKNDAAAVFEAAVDARVKELTEQQIEQHVATRLNERLDAAYEQQKNEIAERVAEAGEKAISELTEQIRSEIANEYREKYDQLIEANNELIEQVDTLEHKIEQSAILEEQAVVNKAAELSVEKVQTLVDRVASYVDYIAEQYVQANREAIESQSKVMIAESVLDSIRGVFADYGAMPVERGEAIDRKIKQLKADRDEAYVQLAEAVEAHYELSNQVEQLQRDAAFAELTEGLTAVDRDRVHRLMEGDRSSLDAYKTRVRTLVESFDKPADAKVPSIVSESVPAAAEPKSEQQALNEQVDADVAFFANALRAGKSSWH